MQAVYQGWELINVFDIPSHPQPSALGYDSTRDLFLHSPPLEYRTYNLSGGVDGFTFAVFWPTHAHQPGVLPKQQQQQQQQQQHERRFFPALLKISMSRRRRRRRAQKMLGQCAASGSYHWHLPIHPTRRKCCRVHHALHRSRIQRWHHSLAVRAFWRWQRQRQQQRQRCAPSSVLKVVVKFRINSSISSADPKIFVHLNPIPSHTASSASCMGMASPYDHPHQDTPGTSGSEKVLHRNVSA
jgi:hypothetical protein